MRDWLYFSLFLALRILLLGEDGGGRKEGEGQHFRQLVLWEQDRRFVLTQGGVFDFCRGGRRL